MIVRPLQARESGRRWSLGAAGWILASALYASRFDATARIAVVGVAVVVAIGVLSYVALSRRRTKLAAIDGHLVVSGPFHTRSLLADRVAWRVVKADVAWGGPSARRSELWLLVNATGKAELGLNRAAWDESKLETLREMLGLSLEVDPLPKRPGDLRRAYPRSIAWWAAHPVAATLLVIVALVVVAFAF